MNVYNPMSKKRGKKSNSIFLAGGITNCPDWQKEMINLLRAGKVKLDIFNPRREEFDFSSEKESIFQIEWEYKNLNMCNYILFWFPKESICPITLYELGRYVMKGKHIFIGVEKGYPRAFDVYKQMELSRPDIEIVDTLEKLATQITNGNNINKKFRDKELIKIIDLLRTSKPAGYGLECWDEFLWFLSRDSLDEYYENVNYYSNNGDNDDESPIHNYVDYLANSYGKQEPEGFVTLHSDICDD